MENTQYPASYEVNPLTMAVLACQTDSGKTTAYVLEQDAEYKIPSTPTRIIDLSCAFFGASLKG